MRFSRHLRSCLALNGVAASALAVWLLAPATARAAGKQGDVVQTDSLGMNLVNHALDTGKTTTVADEGVLAEFVGAHYYLVDRVRLGMNLQFSEQLAPAPGPKDGSDFRTFALLPQIGWDFWGPMFTALVVTVAPWTSGTSTFDFGLQALLGVGVPIAERVKITGAVEVPFNFVVHRTVGLTPLVGVSIRL